MAPLSDEPPPAELATMPPIIGFPSQKDLQRQYYGTETPLTVMGPPPLRSPTSGVVGVGESNDETTVTDNVMGQTVVAAGFDVDVSRGDGRHEGG